MTVEQMKANIMRQKIEIIKRELDELQEVAYRDFGNETADGIYTARESLDWILKTSLK